MEKLLLLGGLVFVFTQFANKSAFWDQFKGKKEYSLKPLFDNAEKRYGIPNNILAKMGYRESAFQESIVKGNKKGGAGEIGIMQITPKWHPNAPFGDTKGEILYAAKYLRENYDRFKNWQYAVMAYNWGPTAVQKWIEQNKPANMVPVVTQNYIRSVFG